MPKNNSLVTIVVPIYNVEHYLVGTVGSLLKQTYKNLEIILIDDGSTDSSGVIVDSFAEKDRRIRVIHQDNAGVSAARNIGMKSAKGDYITFVDGDDIADNDLIRTLVKLIETTNSDIAMTSYVTQTDRNNVRLMEPSEDTYALTGNEAAACLLYGKQIHNHVFAKIYRSQTIKGLTFDTNISIGEDLLFNYLALSRAKKVIINKSRLYAYLIRSGSAMNSTFSNKRTGIFLAVEQILENIESIPSSIKLTKAVRAKYIDEATYMLASIPNRYKYEQHFNMCATYIRQYGKYVLADRGARFATRTYALLGYTFPTVLYYVLMIKKKVRGTI